MKYSSCLLTSALLLTGAFLGGCASFPHTDISAAEKLNLHSIAIQPTQAPETVSVVNVGGVGASFGLIGALAQKAINDSHSRTYNARVQQEGIVFGQPLESDIASQLVADGFTLSRLENEGPADTTKDAAAGLTGIHTNADAILYVLIFTTRYYSPPGSLSFIPSFMASVTLTDAKTRKNLYVKTFSCGNDVQDNSVFVPADPTYAYRSFSKLENNFEQSIAGLKACSHAIAQRVGQDFADQKKTVASTGNPP